MGPRKHHGPHQRFILSNSSTNSTSLLIQTHPSLDIVEMGSSTSKAVKTASKTPAAAHAAARKYPTRPPPSSPRTNAETRRLIPEAAVGPIVHPEAHASPSR